ncbi:MAG: bifunctional diguanylate cyclase/phosphodiesterase, partial [Pseudomonadota bacterium]
GLPNRQYFWQTLEHKIRRQDPLYLLYLDVQHFKRINELYGHSAGDHILIQAAKRIKDFTAEQDFVARIGADEFAIIRLCNNSNDEKYNKQSCEKFADALLNAFIQPLYTNKQQGCTLAINIGIAHYPNHALQAESLVKNADIALGEARLPENPSRKFFSSALQKNVEEKLELETQLRKAITDGNFDIYLQPILDLNTESVVKAEALLRWQVRDEVFVSPDVFIPLAERTGLIVPLGKWVIRQVCELLADFRKSNLNIKLSINLSPKQVTDRYLFDFISSTVKQLGVDAKKLELELTESVLLEDYDKATHLLSEFRKMGVTIAIDDFGTGYSSLSYLKHLPIDHLKIDRSFVVDLDKDEDDKAIVLSIIAMAKQLHLSVIAEGVENKRQRDFLKQNDCASAQGFFYSKPMPVNEFSTFIDAYKTA